MNTQPYETPPQWWAPQMKPWWVRWNAGSRQRALRQQGITRVEVEGLESVKAWLDRGAGVLFTPNHSFHYDSYCLMEAVAGLSRPLHFMTAWQVFAETSALGRLSLQWHGCFSINREGTDVAALKQATQILQAGPYPLVIFPEGDIYHTNDRVTPFRDGAAAIALGAARKSQRPIVCVPTALRKRYVVDPTPQLTQVMDRLEQSLHWRVRSDRPLVERLYAVAEGLLVLKELEYRRGAQSGSVRERTTGLMEHVLRQMEAAHQIKASSGIVSERVQQIRRKLIKELETEGLPAERRRQLTAEMEDLFFVIQLFSYPGDYVAQNPTVERIAETIDKFEEDVLHAKYPAPRGQSQVTVRFGEPIVIPTEKSAQPSTETLTQTLQTQVQALLDGRNG